MKTFLLGVSFVLFGGGAIPGTAADVTSPSSRVRLPAKATAGPVVVVPDGGTVIFGGLPPIRVRPGG